MKSSGIKHNVFLLRKSNKKFITLNHTYILTLYTVRSVALTCDVREDYIRVLLDRYVHGVQKVCSHHW